MICGVEGKEKERKIDEIHRGNFAFHASVNARNNVRSNKKKKLKKNDGTYELNGNYVS